MNLLLLVLFELKYVFENYIIIFSFSMLYEIIDYINVLCVIKKIIAENIGKIA
jgi:hypothetical protein